MPKQFSQRVSITLSLTLALSLAYGCSTPNANNTTEPAPSASASPSSSVQANSSDTQASSTPSPDPLKSALNELPKQESKITTETKTDNSLVASFATSADRMALISGAKMTITVQSPNDFSTLATKNGVTYRWTTTQGFLTNFQGNTAQWTPENRKGELASGTVTIAVIAYKGEANFVLSELELEASEREVVPTKQRIGASQSSNTTVQAFFDSVKANPGPTPTPTPLPSQASTPIPIITPTPLQPSPTPTPVGATSTPTPTPTPTPPPSTTFNGKIYDDTNAPLDGVEVRARSLTAGSTFDATTTTAGGTYTFNNAPLGVQIEITATKPGFATRQRVEVLKENNNGDPNANKYDFGNDGSNTTFSPAYQGLSDKPEVVATSPTRSTSGIQPNADIVLGFSEPMDKQTVEDSVVLRAFTTDTTSIGVSFTGSGSLAAVTGTQIWDKNAFTFNWNADNTAVSLSFKNELKMISDKESSNVVEYQVSFSNDDNRNIKDAQGISRTEKHFKLTSGDYEESFKFGIQTDTVQPKINSVTAQTAENSGIIGDAILVSWNKPMVYYTKGPIVAGGANGTATQAAAAVGNVTASQAACNYNVEVLQSGTGTQLQNGTWCALGGTAVFDGSDPTHKRVILLPPAATNLWAPGDTVRVTPNTTILGPAGNQASTSGSPVSANAS